MVEKTIVTCWASIGLQNIEYGKKIRKATYPLPHKMGGYNCVVIPPCVKYSAGLSIGTLQSIVCVVHYSLKTLTQIALIFRHFKPFSNTPVIPSHLSAYISFHKTILGTASNT